MSFDSVVSLVGWLIMLRHDGFRAHDSSEKFLVISRGTQWIEAEGRARAQDLALIIEQIAERWIKSCHGWTNVCIALVVILLFTPVLPSW